MPISEPLRGGNINDVRREGDVVVRTAGPWTDTVHHLLRHVRSRGFLLAPEPLSVIDGKERLQFFDGETVGDDEPWPQWAWSDTLLCDAARAARAFHDAVSDIRFDELPCWRIPQLDQTGSTLNPNPDTVVCHNDLAPYNVVVEQGRLVGVIDWDLVAPGSRLWELAFMAWQWVPLHYPDLATRLGWREPDQLGRRLRLLCDSYGLDDRNGLVDMIVARIEASRSGIQELASQGDPAFVRLMEEGHTHDMAATITHINEIRASLENALL